MNVQTLNQRIEDHKKSLGLAHQQLVESCNQYGIMLDKFLLAQAQLTVAKAKAYLSADGTIDERKAKRDIGCQQAQTACDIAEVQCSCARDRKDIAKSALENARAELSAIQSQVKLFETEANLVRSGF